MLDRNDDRTITALVADVLDALRKNLKEHKEIVEEARAGYIEKAQKALDKRMAQLKEGKIVSLSFSLHPPTDHSKDFETVIKMLELHQAALKDVGKVATIKLKAVDVQRFVLNDWSWMDRFLTTSSAYSEKARILSGDRS